MARRLDDGLCCLTEDAAFQLHRRRCSFITSGSPLKQNGRHPTVIQDKMSALHMATSHFVGLFCFICHFYPPFTRKRVVSLYFGREVRTRLGVAFFEVYGPPVFHIKAGASR